MKPKLNTKYKCEEKTMEVLARDFQGKYQVVVYDSAGHYVIRHLDDYELRALFNSRDWEVI